MPGVALVVLVCVAAIAWNSCCCDDADRHLWQQAHPCVANASPGVGERPTAMA
jgi:hypothetical protein